MCEKFNLQLTIVIDLHVQMLKTGGHNDKN